MSVLRSLDSKVLLDAGCYFGGGTQLTLSFGEYRESKYIDFLCSSRGGFRKLREAVTQKTLGPILSKSLPFAREVRADRDGIRTFFAVDGVHIKFEILLEGRIDIEGSVNRVLGVPVLSTDVAIAEKFLANADRGLDESVQGRDVIDLAFLAAHVGKRGLLQGLAIAQHAYGNAVLRSLTQSLGSFQRHRTRTVGWLKSLQVSDTQTLRRGLRVLRTL